MKFVLPILSALSVLPALTALTLTSSLHALPPGNVALWEEDLEVYAQTLQARHINLFHTRSQREFETDLQALRQDLPRLTEAARVTRLMQIHHRIGDGHTAIPLWERAYDRFPLDVEIVQGRAILTGLGDDHADMLGGEILSINDRPIDEVLARVFPVVPFTENAGSDAVRVAAYLPVAPFLHALGLSDTPDTLRLQVAKSGQTHALTFQAGPRDAYSDALTHRLTYREPLEDSMLEAAAPGLGFVYEADHQLGYIRFDRYPPAAEMDQFAREVVSVMRRESGRYLVIDLRDNYGGDFYTGLRLAHQLNLLDQIDWQSGVFVLTGPVTFSAAMSNAAQFSDILHARRVGEPTGATPCGYQDMGQFNLPNSGLLITYSKRHFCFAEPVDDALQPDHPVPVTVEHWRTGHDAAMAWVRAEVEDLSTRDSR